MDNFTPHLYIGIGLTGAYFTLREAFLSETHGYETVSSGHHFNLSQDADEALEKATFCAIQMGLPLKADINTMKQEMRDISRATAESEAARKRKLEEQQEEFLARHELYIADLRKILHEGRYAIGRYKGLPFDAASIAYINWLARILKDTECTDILTEQAEAAIAACPHKILPVPKKKGFFGNIDERITIPVTIIRNISVDNMYGKSYIVTMIDDNNGLCFVSMGAFNPTVGDKMTIKGRIKSHDTYKEQDQTRLQRISII